MAKYRKKPVVIEAFEWTGDSNQKEDPTWLVDKIKNNEVYFTEVGNSGVKLHIKTLEGIMTAEIGDYIIKGVNNEVYPCKPDIFHKTYEKVE